MLIKDQKKALRKEMFGKRGAIAAAIKIDYDNWICAQLEQLILGNKYKVVHCYIPLPGEINISPLIEKLLQLNITVVCPKTLPKRKLENRILKSLNDLEVGIMGTQHPAEVNIYEGNYDLIVVPGLAYDINKFRLGYGGGYYDNFLNAQPDAYKVGIFYPFQLVANVPVEPHDFCLDIILAKELG